MDPTTAASASTFAGPAILLSGTAAGADEPYGAVSSDISDSLEKGDLPVEHAKLHSESRNAPSTICAFRTCV